MKGQAKRESGTRLRELASRTLEAYRSLNEAAARSAANGNDASDAVARAGEVLEEVLGTLQGRSGGA